LITTSGGMILPGKDVQIERKCGDRTATAKGAGGENEAARRLGSRSESAFPSRGGSPPPVEVPFGLPWWRTKLSNTQPCRWCPFPPSTLTSANSKQLLFSNPILLLNEGQRAASSLSRLSLVLPKPLKKFFFLRGCPSASLHSRLSTPVSPPLLCFFTRRKERTEEQKRAQV